MWYNINITRRLVMGKLQDFYKSQNGRPVIPISSMIPKDPARPVKMYRILGKPGEMIK